jgi:hypothetical protein
MRGCGSCMPYPHPPPPQVCHCQSLQIPRISPQSYACEMRCNSLLRPYQPSPPSGGLSISAPLASEKTAMFHSKPTPPPKSPDIYVTAASTSRQQATRSTEKSSTTIGYFETSSHVTRTRSTVEPSEGKLPKKLS